jgi:hypothetical protein
MVLLRDPGILGAQDTPGSPILTCTLATVKNQHRSLQSKYLTPPSSLHQHSSTTVPHTRNLPSRLFKRLAQSPPFMLPTLLNTRHSYHQDKQVHSPDMHCDIPRPSELLLLPPTTLRHSVLHLPHDLDTRSLPLTLLPPERLSLPHDPFTNVRDEVMPFSPAITTICLLQPLPHATRCPVSTPPYAGWCDSPRHSRSLANRRRLQNTIGLLISHGGKLCVVGCVAERLTHGTNLPLNRVEFRRDMPNNGTLPSSASSAPMEGKFSRVDHLAQDRITHLGKSVSAFHTHAEKEEQY